jgi:hypothetical protein
MSLFDDIIAVYSELTNKDFHPINGAVALKDDGDGIAYIAKWEYSQPLPEGMKVGK